MWEMSYRDVKRRVDKSLNYHEKIQESRQEMNQKGVPIAEIK